MTDSPKKPNQAGVRFYEALQKLIKIHNIKQYELARILDISPGNIPNYAQGRNGPGTRTKRMLAEKFNVNIEWLESGEGEMFIKDSLVAEPVENFGKGKATIRRTQEVPLYNMEASMGLVSLYNDQARTIDHVRIPNLPACDGAIYASGDSMYPVLKSGDIVIFRKVNDLISGIFYGEIYVIDIDIEGERYTTIKYIQKSELGSDWIKLVSHNEHHQSKDIQLKYVKALAMVKASVRIMSI